MAATSPPLTVPELKAGFQKIHFLETGLFTFLNDVKYMVECSHYAGENNRDY
jgi:hypothetical protein